MKSILFFGMVFYFLGCVSPKQWTQNQHQDQMLMCKKMCEGVGVAKYETFTGDCMCYQQSQPLHTSILR